MQNTYPDSAKNTGNADFVLRFKSWGGADLCNGIHSRETELILTGANQLAKMEKHRSESDAEGEAIGWFQMKLDSSAMMKVRNVLMTTPISDLQVVAGAGLGASMLDIEVQESARKYALHIPSNDIASLQRIDPLLNALYSIQDALVSSPVAALRVDVRPQNVRDTWSFAIVIRNIGAGDVTFVDPRCLDTSEDTWAGVRIAPFPPEVPGTTSPPLVWSRLRVSRLSAGNQPSSKVVSLHSKEDVAFPTDTWDSAVYQTGMRYLVQGVFSDYSNVGDRNRVIKGAAFSKAIEVVP